MSKVLALEAKVFLTARFAGLDPDRLAGLSTGLAERGTMHGSMMPQGLRLLAAQRDLFNLYAPYRRA